MEIESDVQISLHVHCPIVHACYTESGKIFFKPSFD